jgi:hypothetical protein
MSVFRVCGLKWGPIWKLPIHTTKAGASKLLQIMSMFAQEIEEAETVARVIKHEGGRARPCNAAKPLVGAAPPLGCICGAGQTGDRKNQRNTREERVLRNHLILVLQIRKARPREGDRPAQEHTGRKRPR